MKTLLLTTIAALSTACASSSPHRYSWGEYGLSIPTAAVVGFGSGQAVQGRFMEGGRCRELPLGGVCNGIFWATMDGLAVAALATGRVKQLTSGGDSGRGFYDMGGIILVLGRFAQVFDVIIAPITVDWPSAEERRRDPALAFTLPL